MSISQGDVKLIHDVVEPLLGERHTVLSLGVPKVVGKDNHEKFFKETLGFQTVITLDAKDWEGCDVVHDLNKPIPDSLVGVADLLIDPGTIEHVFDIKQAMENICKMLRPGGVVFHHSPLNWVGHGFVNPCPSLFHDCYNANGFTDVQSWMRRVKDLEYKPWVYKPTVTKILAGHRRYLMAAIAKKGRPCDFVVPQQARYTEGHWKNG